MKNEMLNFPSRKFLFSAYVVSALLINGSQMAFADTSEVQTVWQAVTVKGRIVDATGEPVIGANVTVKGTTNGCVTDFDGNFTLSDAKGTLVVSFIGYQTQEIEVKGNERNLQIILKEDTELLDEVVVVGFGTQKKVNLTGAVSVVSGKELKERPVVNITQALQGMVPGLQISQTNGSLEDRPSINVRGTTTIGEGTKGDPLVLIDGMEGDINSINPQDVESISVLKDVSSSSIYGARAPFGVILITTKSGGKGKTSINYNNSFRWGTPINMKHMMNSVDFASWMNDTKTNGGENVFFGEERMEAIKAYAEATPYGPGQRITSDGEILYSLPEGSNGQWVDAYQGAVDDVEWYDVIYKKWTFSQEHNFSANGGTDKLSYYASFNYLDQGGLMRLGEESYKRYNATAKINAQPTKWMKMNYSIRFSREDYTRPADLKGSLYSDMARQGWPVIPVYDRNGYYYSAPSRALGLAEGGSDNTQTDNIYQQVDLVIEPIKNWITHVDFNYRISSANRHWEKQYLYNHDVNGSPYVFDKSSNVHEDLLKNNYYNFQAYTEYTHVFNQKHNVRIMGGFQAEEYKELKFGLQRAGIIIPGKPEVDLTSGLGLDGSVISPSVNGARNEWSTAGFFGRLNYDFDGKYLLEMNLRYDGTSRFRPGNQWKLFPSISAGWNIANENFFKPLNNIVNLLKIRASYGNLGNQNTNNWYQTYLTLSAGSSNGSWLQNGIKPNTASAPGLVSPTLTWERIESYNLALDWGLLNNRLTGSLEYYVRNTKDMVGKSPALPDILGANVPSANNTDLQTIGWELSLGWKDRLQNGFSYGINLNLYDSRSKIIRYPNNPTEMINSYIPGRWTGEIWGYKTVGIAKTDEEMQAHLSTLPNGGQNDIGSNWTAGDIMYADVNDDGKISGGAGTLSDHGDKVVIGNNTPRYLFGIDLNGSWKGFDLRIFFQGIMKRDYWQGSVFLFGVNSRGMWETAGLTDVADYFRDENTWSVQNGYNSTNLDSYLPRPLYNNKNLQCQSRYLQNASYIRLKNLQIGYTLPQSLTANWGIQSLRIYFSGENLWTGTKLSKQFDPETISSNSGNGYPLSTTLSCGVSLTF